jgi:pimeloyl-ACP methyl ester carboxylesterase
MLRETDASLRRVGQPVFDNVELIWGYDSAATIRRLKVPLLWIFAEADREAPPEVTFARLAALRKEGRDISTYSFPNTDHGIYEFTEAPDGSRKVTRIADGYFSLLTDWIKGSVKASGYGNARKR